MEHLFTAGYIRVNPSVDIFSISHFNDYYYIHSPAFVYTEKMEYIPDRQRICVSTGIKKITPTHFSHQLK